MKKINILLICLTILCSSLLRAQHPIIKSSPKIRSLISRALLESNNLNQKTHSEQKRIKAVATFGFDPSGSSNFLDSTYFWNNPYAKSQMDLLEYDYFTDYLMEPDYHEVVTTDQLLEFNKALVYSNNTYPPDTFYREYLGNTSRLQLKKSRSVRYGIGAPGSTLEDRLSITRLSNGKRNQLSDTIISAGQITSTRNIAYRYDPSFSNYEVSEYTDNTGTVNKDSLRFVNAKLVDAYTLNGIDDDVIHFKYNTNNKLSDIYAYSVTNSDTFLKFHFAPSLYDEYFDTIKYSENYSGSWQTYLIYVVRDNNHYVDSIISLDYSTSPISKNIAKITNNTYHDFTKSVWYNNGIKNREKHYYYEDTYSAIKNSNLETIQCYPNPAQENIYMEFTNSQPKTVKIYAVTGSVLTQSFTNQKNISVNIGNLPAGMYYITIDENGKLYKSSFVKNNN